MKTIRIGSPLRQHVVSTGGLVPSARAWVFALLVGLIGGLAALLVHPILLLLGVVGVVVMVAIPLKGYKVFWSYLLFLLAGYLLFGKGFAYIGSSPVYVAELGLALAGLSMLVALLLNMSLSGIKPFLRFELILLWIFLAWQAACTIPYLETYGADALRDAALWGYAAFALFMLLLIPREAVDKLFVLYGKVLPYYLAWLVVALVLARISFINVTIPGSSVALLGLKAGDVGVHLAGAAAFMLLRLDLRASPWSGARLWCSWGLWTCGWLGWGAVNRAGMFAALVGIAVVLLWRPTVKWYRPLALVVCLVGLLLVTNFALPLSKGEEVSFRQTALNVQSTFGDSYGKYDDNKEWRTDWWKKIAGYTFGGEYFWMGKGYGIDLGVDDDFSSEAKEKYTDTGGTRSPHNVFMTVLARSGVPGLLLWVLFLAGFGAMLARAYLVRKKTDPSNARIALWLLAYWLAFLFNGSFDVFLEGPMGGVLFWVIVGLSFVYFGRDKRPLAPPAAVATRARRLYPTHQSQERRQPHRMR